MAFRKRRSPAPAFRQPSPFNPITGDYARIGKAATTTRLAVFQVVGDDDSEANADTHDDYVLCRGFDPEDGRFYTRIAVAKPYAIRGEHTYTLAQLLVCAKVRTRIGDTPGVCETSVGQPADLAEAIEILYDDDGKVVSWIDLGKPDSVATMRVSPPVVAGYTRKLPQYGVVPISGIYPPSSYAYSNGQYAAAVAGSVLFAINNGGDISLESTDALVDTPYALAFDEPAVALMSAAGRALSGATATGIPLGLIPQESPAYLDDEDDAFCLWPYLPGFRAVHSAPVVHTIDGDTYYKALVLQDYHQHLWGKVKSRCVPHSYSVANLTDVVEIWPCSPPTQSTSVAAVVYDGVTTSPEITLTVQIPAVSGREPNIQEGDFILYKAATHMPVYNSSYRGLLIVSAHYDDPIGTIKLWNAAAAAIPPGWQQISMATPKFLRGGNSLSSGTFGGTGSTYSYQQYLVIERYQ